MKVILKDKTEFEVLSIQRSNTEDESGTSKTTIFFNTNGDNPNSTYDAVNGKFTADNISEVTTSLDNGRTFTDSYTKVDRISLRMTEYEETVAITLV